MINLDEIISSVKENEIQETTNQVKYMESEDIDVLGPMNMLAFDI